jgi:hypothetical protein
VHKGQQIVLENSYFWDNVDGESHIFVVLHWHVQIKILEIDAHKAGILEWATLC